MVTNSFNFSCSQSLQNYTDSISTISNIILFDTKYYMPVFGSLLFIWPEVETTKMPN